MAEDVCWGNVGQWVPMCQFEVSVGEAFQTSHQQAILWNLQFIQQNMYPFNVSKCPVCCSTCFFLSLLHIAHDSVLWIGQREIIPFGSILHSWGTWMLTHILTLSWDNKDLSFPQALLLGMRGDTDKDNYFSCPFQCIHICIHFHFNGVLELLSIPGYP